MNPIATCLSLTALATSLTSATPVPRPSIAALDHIDRIGEPVDKQAAALRSEAKNSIKKSDQRSAAADTKIQSFLAKTGHHIPVVQNDGKKPSGNGIDASAESAPGDKTTKPAKPKQAETTIKVECDGGIYFDNDSGILVYMKNIRLAESNSSFKLRCDNELKIFLDNTAEQKNGKKAPDAESTEQESTKQKDDSFSELGNLKQIIATGKVKIAGKKENGSPFLAEGETASYDARTGEMILKGGRPTLQQTANQFLQAQEPGQWIKIQMQNKRIKSIITSQGKWSMQAVTSKNPQ